MFVTFKSTETREQLTVNLLGKMILFCLAAAVPTDLNVFFLKCTYNRKPAPVGVNLITDMA
jgi:hypothetical protein